ncbi:MAG: hypothetical protein C0625_02365 [Arcobacter sp.]|nr:MAG: hypothetical protein C0625_02365 [Arcobacter sp.]
MRKIFLVLIFTFSIVSSLNATSAKFIKEMNYESDYKTALEKAKKANKSVFMVVSETTCPWCRKLERQTLKKKNINSIIKENFIPLSVEKDINNYPKQF